MKNLMILFIGFIIVSCCNKQENKNNVTVEIKFPIDSVILANYIRSDWGKGTKIVPRNNRMDVLFYYRLNKGNGGYFVFLHNDYSDDHPLSLLLEEKYSYQCAYQIFKRQDILKYFDDGNDYVIDLKLIDTFTVSVDDLNYKIEKYYKPLHVLERNGNVDRDQYHYLSDKLGLIAIDSYSRIFVATRNSAVADSIMTYISKKVIENIESNEF